MSLSEFKAKHYHLPKGDKRSGPFCSDQYSGANPDEVSITAPIFATPAMTSTQMKELQTQADQVRDAYIRAGLIDCQIYFPFEQIQGSVSTIPNIPMKLLNFKFVDGRLFNISGLFLQEKFERMRQAFVTKYGLPTSTEQETYQNSFGATFPGVILTWNNGVSSITLAERTSRADTSSLTFLHLELAREADRKQPKPRPDL